MVRLKLATLGYEPSALAIEFNSSKAIAGKESSLPSWCIASLYIYHFSTVVDISFLCLVEPLHFSDQMSSGT